MRARTSRVGYSLALAGVLALTVAACADNSKAQRPVVAPLANADGWSSRFVAGSTPIIDGASLETLLQEMRPTQRPAAPDKTSDPDATGAGPRRPDDQAERDTVREPRGQCVPLCPAVAPTSACSRSWPRRWQ